MAIRYECVCGQQITTYDDRAGKLEHCPGCRMSVQVPDHGKGAPKKDRGSPGTPAGKTA